MNVWSGTDVLLVFSFPIEGKTIADYNDINKNWHSVVISKEEEEEEGQVAVGWQCIL